MVRAVSGVFGTLFPRSRDVKDRVSAQAGTFTTDAKTMDEKDKPSADEAALSAAYAITAAADRIWLTRTAEVGSIGVVAVHVDESVADAKAGFNYTFLHAGAHKVDGHPHAPLPAPVAADIQTDIEQLHAGDLAALRFDDHAAADAAIGTGGSRFSHGGSLQASVKKRQV